MSTGLEGACCQTNIKNMDCLQEDENYLTGFRCNEAIGGSH